MIMIFYLIKLKRLYILLEGKGQFTLNAVIDQ